MKYIIKYHDGSYLIGWRGNGSVPVFGVIKEAREYDTKREAMKELGTLLFETDYYEVIPIKDGE